MRFPHRLYVGLLLLILTATSASAQTFSLDRQRDQHEFGMRLDFGFVKDNGDITSKEAYLRTEVYGQFVSGAFGGYMSLPLARNMTSDNQLEERTSIGNIELGGYWMTVAGPVDFIFRLGLSLPTADASLEGFATNARAGLGRLNDHLNVEPGILGARLSLSPVIDAGLLFLRLDVGFDFVFRVRDLRNGDAGAASAAREAAQDDFRTYLRANLGVGADFGPATLAIEFVNLVSLADRTLPYGLIAAERSMHSLAFGAWFNVDIVHPYVAFTVPLDVNTRTTQGFVTTVGVEVRL